MPADTLPAADRRRAAELMLACLDDDGADRATAVLDECDRKPGAMAGLVAALVSGSLELLISVAGVDNARKTLNLALLDASVDSE